MQKRLYQNRLASSPQSPDKNLIGCADRDRTRAPWPAVVTFYPVMGIAAARHKSHAGGGWRLYVLAKALAQLDPKQDGTILRDDLRAYVLSLGASPRLWQLWIKQARVLGLVRDVQTRSGEWRLILPAPRHAADAMNGETIGSRKAKSMSARDLIGKGWRARVWAAYEEAIFNERPITRERMQKLVNVPTRTQRFRDNQAGVHRQRNYAKSQLGADAAPMLQEHSDHRGVFATRDHRIAWRLPDIRTSTLAQRGARGRARKENRALAQLRLHGPFQMPRPLGDTPARAFVRLFHWTAAGRKAAMRKLAHQDHPIRELYELAGQARSGAQLWTPYGAI